MRIAVYSGSFDPLHIGHLAIMQHLTTRSGFDWVYLVISPQNPLKDPEKAKSGEDRYEAAIAAVRRYPELHVWVDNIELGMEPPHYTLRTLLALKEREPGNDFTLVVGADNLENFRKWADYKRILKEFGLVVYPRDGKDCEALRRDFLREDPSYKIELTDISEVEVSSTEIRKERESGEDVTAKLM